MQRIRHSSLSSPVGGIDDRSEMTPQGTTKARRPRVQFSMEKYPTQFVLQRLNRIGE
jgi:hypothetical protein